jgi:SpoVK/Ycf46/Vps4 family AAA+-type ATPase
MTAGARLNQLRCEGSIMAKQLDAQPDNLEEAFLHKQAYMDQWEHYADELRLLDMRLKLLYWQRQQLTPDPQMDAYRGMFVSEDEFMRLVGGSHEHESEGPEQGDLQHLIQQMETLLAGRLQASKENKVYLPLVYLSSVFGLGAPEERTVLLALAVELDRKYERIYGYLQDDLTRKTPNISLALQFACRTSEEMQLLRSAFEPGGKLGRYLLHKQDQDSADRSTLSRPVVLDRRFVLFLMNSGDMDESLKPAVQIMHPDQELEPFLIHDDIQKQIQAFIQEMYIERKNSSQRLAFYLWGGKGAGKKLHARHCCQHFNKPLIVADLEVLKRQGKRFEDLIHTVLREAILRQAVLCFTHLEALFPEEPDEAATQLVHAFYEKLQAFNGLLFLLAERYQRLDWNIKDRMLIEQELKVPEEGQRAAIWANLAQQMGVEADVEWRVMGSKFRFTPGQIRRALDLARGFTGWQRVVNGNGNNAQTGRDVPIRVKLQTDALYKACYQQVQHKLEKKATRIEPRYEWDDIILPPEQKDQLRNACNQVKYRSVVYGDWGFEKKLAYGKGLSMLFAGPPGTGKTMSAQVVARELQLELYKIDLSQVISKYIGETEKNLHEIFQEAQLSNAVLFFDETDALFGKRSEVKDSHDKYANIETAYLLQKMEEYQGITVLATNLLGNIDEAFLRRINYIIKFPFPDAEYREKIWQSMFPPEAPLSEDMDFKYVAAKFEIAGGNIKNVAVSAAFLAAEAGSPIRMRHILHSLRHELQKSGKIITKQDWDEY